MSLPNAKHIKIEENVEAKIYIEEYIETKIYIEENSL